MNIPVRCTHCGKVYNLATVEITQRYADCSMWISPCCKKLVDDRGETGWKSFSDYTRISPATANRVENTKTDVYSNDNELFYDNTLGQTRN